MLTVRQLMGKLAEMQDDAKVAVLVKHQVRSDPQRPQLTTREVETGYEVVGCNGDERTVVLLAGKETVLDD